MLQSIQIRSPIDGKVYAQRPVATDTAIEASLARASASQTAWRHTPLAERIGILAAAVGHLNAAKVAIGEELAWQMGRPVRYGPNEITRGFTERAEYMAQIAPEVLADTDAGAKDGFKRFIRRDPAGTVLVIAPWNYPYLTAVNSIWPALLAGNAVILKHSSKTLLVGERFQQALDLSLIHI